MATAPAHRPSQSVSSNNLQTPSPTPRPRRLTSPSQASLSIPEGRQQQQIRPPSPLRNGFIPDTSTGIDPNNHSDDDDDDDDDDDGDNDRGRWVERSPSPSSSVSQLAATFAQRVGSFVEGIKSRSPQLPTDAELEAEAERERDRSRREAEAILTREADQRRLVEERVLAMMETTKSLPPPPSRTAIGSNPPSPSGSNREKESVGWWTAAKNRLTPTKDKDSLTPAQQIIQEAKAREKEQKKNSKGKEREKVVDWSANSQGKHGGDATLANLNIPASSPQRRSVTGSPVSSTPSRPSLSNMPPNLSPSPMRSVDNLSSPGRESLPLYAQFNSQGTLDVHGTLLVVAKRFEKLEKWTVGHVRALEERMNDVERWLVDKEKEREQGNKTETRGQSSSSDKSEVHRELSEIRDEVGELQGRVGELGREMARIAAAPANLSSGPARQSVSMTASPTNSMIATHHSPSASTTSTPHHSRLLSATARESTSPPMASSSKASGTRLPYPTGDYTSPPDSFSPPSSPPSLRSRPVSISGLPNANNANMSTSYSNTSFSTASSITRAVSPTSSLTNINRAVSPSGSITSVPRSSPNLPPPRTQKRDTSVSPTPRKRYTVALGEPIRSQSPPARDEEATPLSTNKKNGTPISFLKPQTSIGSAMFSSAPISAASGNEDEDDFQDETIGKSAAARLAASGGYDNAVKSDVFSNSVGAMGRGDYKSSEATSSNSRPARRPRPQSTYAFGSSIVDPPQASIQPLKPRLRSKSTDRFGSTDSLSSVSSVSSATSGKFVDPLVIRTQEKEKEKGRSRGTAPNAKGKVAVGQLVAFFDGDKEKQ